MTDPMNALTALQQALNAGGVRLALGSIDAELSFIFDQPNGTPRFTYALVDRSEVLAIALFVTADPVQGTPCFNIGYAVVEAARRRGLGFKVVSLAFDELTHGLKRAGVVMFYVEAVISIDNLPSNGLAKKVFSEPPDSGVDSFSGEPMLHYLKKVDLRQ